MTRISSAPTDDVVASPSVRTKAAEAKHSSLACITIDRWSGPRSADVDSLILHSPANVKASRSGVSLMSYLLCLCLPLRKQRGEVPAHHYCSQSESRILTGRQKNWPPPPPAKEGRFQHTITVSIYLDWPTKKFGHRHRPPKVQVEQRQRDIRACTTKLTGWVQCWTGGVPSPRSYRPLHLSWLAGSLGCYWAGCLDA